MTPADAVDKLLRNMDGGGLRSLFEAVAATAKAEAKKEETLRCERKVAAVAATIERGILSQVTRPDTKGLVQSIVNTLNSLANDLRTTGGLEVEATDGKIRE